MLWCHPVPKFMTDNLLHCLYFPAGVYDPVYGMSRQVDQRKTYWKKFSYVCITPKTPTHPEQVKKYWAHPKIKIGGTFKICSFCS